MSARLAELRARFDAHRQALASGDAVAFARLVGIAPDPWQASMLLSTSKRLLLCCSRQAGKSTAAAVLVSHRAVNFPKHLALLVSPSLRQSGELFRKVRACLDHVPELPKITEDNAHSVALANGSRIVSLPSSEDTIRGYSAVDTLVEDEAAFVDDEVHAAIRPMLAVSAGQLVLMSSPNGRRGHFFEAWERGGKDWERFTVTGWDVPRIPRTHLEDERRALGELRFRQEYECAFLSASTGAVYRFTHDRNVITSVDKTRGAWTFILGIDYGFSDETAFAVVGWRQNDPTVYGVECWKAKGLTPSDAAMAASELEREYEFARIVGDIGGLGKGYAEEARKRFSLPIEPAEKNNKRGFIDLLNGELAAGTVKVTDVGCKQLLEEWRDLSWDERRQKEASGFANHCADAFLYAWRACGAYHERHPEKKPRPGTPEALALEEKRIEESMDEEIEAEGDRVREGRGRYWR